MLTVLLLLTSIAGLALVVGIYRALKSARRTVIEVQPRYRSFFRHLGLLEAEHFLSLKTVIVSGHPDRNVGRVNLGEGSEVISAYLKREHDVPWPARLASFLAGFGFVSRSLREGRTLQALHREGIGCAEWLAAGEDDKGRAFLLIREVTDAVELRAYLRDEKDAGCRARAMKSLAAALARLHHAGFDHPDLYAKHILINPSDAAIHVLDWQRSVRRRLLGWQARARDLAALHATMADDLASPRERLFCLRAYLAEVTARPPALPPAGIDLRLILHKVQALTRRKLLRRHVREKRQLPIAPDAQDWICIHGEELCVTRSLDQAWPGRDPEWLAFDRQPVHEGRPVSRRWLPRANGGSALLVRRTCRPRIPAWWAWLRRKPFVSLEKRQAGLLFRLERHAVPGPRVLALGQRQGPGGRYESFLLTEPIDASVRLDTWMVRALQCKTQADLGQRRRLLRDVGEILYRLHEAGCYLNERDVCEVLAVRTEDGGQASVVLSSVDGLRLRRRLLVRSADRDLVRVCRSMAAAGCGRSDLRRLTRAYERRAAEGAGSALATRSYRSLSGIRTAPVPGRGVRPAELTPNGNPISGPLNVTSDSTPRGLAGFWHRLVRGCRRVRHRSDWNRFAGPKWAERIMDMAVTDRFHAKQGRSTGRCVLQAPDENGGRLIVYLKRHYQLPWWQGWLAAVWPAGNWSPAMQEWEHLEWARRQGVPVPPVVAAGEFVGPWGRLRSFLAVEELTDMLPLHEAIPLASSRLDPATFARWKRTLVAEMARLTRMLHDRRCFHKDLYLCHFYIPRTDTGFLPQWRGRMHLIDLHRLGHHHWNWRMWQLKDLAQLLYSSEIDGVNPRDQLAFWAEYRGNGPRRGADRWLRWWVLFKWRRYRRHNLRQKAKAA